MISLQSIQANLIFIFISHSLVILENVDKAWTKVRTKSDNVAGKEIFLISFYVIVK